MTLSGYKLTMALAALVAAAPAVAVARPQKAPTAESFSATAQVVTSSGAAGTQITMQVDRYSPDADRDGVAAALKQGGYPAFLQALRKAPVVGTVSMAGQTVDIRWARQEPGGKYQRTIVLITDKPLFFVGGGSVTAKPREGYEVAVLRFDIDGAGLGFDGVMAAAARVKPGGPTGVQIDDYAEKPIKLTTVRRTSK